ncbi:MAG: hypothetical protein H6Q74_52 [Firmicutes bacterium]|nr:hypothetical protein [Bacillota bacterium]
MIYSSKQKTAQVVVVVIVERITGGRLAKKILAMSSRSGRKPKSVKLFKAAAWRASSIWGVIIIKGIDEFGAVAVSVVVVVVRVVSLVAVIVVNMVWEASGTSGDVGLVGEVGMIASEKTAFWAMAGLVS